MKCSVRQHKKRILASVLLFALPAASLSFPVSSAAGAGIEARVGHGILLAKHKGVPHGLLHSLGRKGSGICPQSRTTANAPDEFYTKSNPLPPTQENIDVGRALYQVDAQPTACKICHGAEGNGFGMMAQGLIPMPRNFTCAETMKDISDGQMFWIIKNGSPGTGMPPYSGLSDEQVWQLVLYLRQFAE